jgi:hypothetical protein
MGELHLKSESAKGDIQHTLHVLLDEVQGLKEKSLGEIEGVKNDGESRLHHIIEEGVGRLTSFVIGPTAGQAVGGAVADLFGGSGKEK